MEETIFFIFLQILPDFFRLDLPYVLVGGLLFLGCGALQFYMLHRSEGKWILPGSLLMLEVSCELMVSSISSSAFLDGLLFVLVGTGSLFGLAGTLAGALIHLLRTKVRH